MATDWDHVRLVFETIIVIGALFTMVWAVRKRSGEIRTIIDCEKIRGDCLTTLKELKTEKEVVSRLEVVTEQLENELKTSKTDRRKLFDQVEIVFSHVGDIKTVLSFMAIELMKDSPQLKFIEELLKRKAKE